MAPATAVKSKSKFAKGLKLWSKVALFLSLGIALCFLVVYLFRIVFIPTPREVLFDNYLFRFQTAGFNSQNYTLSGPSFLIGITRGYQFFIVASEDVRVVIYYQGVYKGERFLPFGSFDPKATADRIQIIPTSSNTTKAYVFSKLN
jgi:hypothetical protein